MRRSRQSRPPLTFEARLRVFSTLAGVVVLALCAAVLALLHVSTGPLLVTLAILLLALILVFAAFIEDAVRPVQTLANVVAALREEDYSFRARNAGRDDSLGQLALEINALADTLQTQRVGALEAVALLRRVIAEMDAPVLAFDQESRLRLLNPAAERVFALLPARDLGRSAADLTLQPLLDQPTDTVLPADTPLAARPAVDKSPRWMIRRGSFRQRGVPHTLIVLSDVSAALREEERLAWRRLIRVIGHEISNSLTPIKSIAGSLRSRLQPAQPRNGTIGRDLNRGLSVIENRADSLNRFVQAYRQLAQLPAPNLRRVPLVPLLERVVSLEIRLDVRILSAPEVDLLADPDQIEQLLINLVRNAVEAATLGREETDLVPAEIPEDTEENVILSEARHEASSAVEEPGLSGARSAEPKAPAISGGEQRVSRSGVEAPQVTLRALLEGDLAAIQIEDNGPGLANPDNLFVPLYTTKKSGSGVGLALARQIVEAHGGAITLRNRAAGPGCLAEVRIPIAQAAP
jgi:two-component system, NtrC family, nitrogen regulation sensor histidine kinase NtrY